MANTSISQFIDTLNGVLSFAGGTGSVNLYMAHGGTNFGYTAGALALPTLSAMCPTAVPKVPTPLIAKRAGHVCSGAG